MKNLKITVKLLLSFSIVIVMSIIIGVVGIVAMSLLSNSADQIYRSNLRGVLYMGSICENIQQQRVNMRNAILYDYGTAEYTQNMDTQNKRQADIEEYFTHYQSTIVSQEDQDIFDQALDAYYDEFVPAREAVFSAAQTTNDVEALMVYLNAATASVQTMTGLFQTSYKMNEEDAIAANDDTTRLATLATVISIIVLLVSIFAAIALALYVSTLIAKPMRFISKYVSDLADTGDLSLVEANKAETRLYTSQQDEIGITLNAVDHLLELMQQQGNILQVIANKDLSGFVTLRSDRSTVDLIAASLLDSLNEVLSNIQLSANQVSTVSQQIADGSQALAQGSTEQAAAVEELSASISEVSDKTKKNADMAKRAAHLGNTIKDNAEKGSSQMDSMMSAVKEINDASQNISKVIKVIDDIAFQTNILALNAAVEAARAGQHGKGFAVVAEEVRNLAAKSAEAAKDTEDLIANSMEKAQLGARIAEETAQSLVEIVAGINESSQIVDEIASSSEEQAMSISQINNGINQVAQVVQQNSATSEESAASAEEMSSQANILAELSSQFKLRNNPGSSNVRKSNKSVSKPSSPSPAPAKKPTPPAPPLAKRPTGTSYTPPARPKTIDLDKY